MATKATVKKSSKKSAAAKKSPSVKRATLPAMNHRPGSLADKAHSFIAANPTMDRAEKIKALKSKFKLTENTAAHWAHLFSKHSIAKTEVKKAA